MEPGETNDALACSLKHVRSLHDHEFEAVSYVWGESPKSHVLHCGGSVIEITPNVDRILRRLRHPDRLRRLWIDAICINQDDVAERSRQVRNMQDIYSAAKQVIIWLGGEDINDILAFDSLKRLEAYWKPGNDNWLRMGWYRDRAGKTFSGGAHMWMPTDIERLHLVNLLLRDWFRRTWVIQEAASAKRAVVLYGTQSMPWEAFADLYMRLGEHFLPVTQLGGETARQSLENITAIENTRRSHTGPLSMSLFHILVATSFSQCKDPRDKIFAVVGLAKDGVEKKDITLDYTVGEEKVLEAFKDFAIIDSNRNKDLRTLSCSSGTADSYLPSWVPGWRRIENSHPFVLYSDRTKFCASGDMKAVAWHSDDQTTLHVKGKIIDRVEVLGRVPTFTQAIAIFEITEEKVGQLQRSFEWLLECRNLALDPKGILTARKKQMLWRTLTCGPSAEDFPAPQRYAMYFDNYMAFMETASNYFHECLVESQTAPTGIRGLDQFIPYFENHAIIEASLYQWSARRRICRTLNGQLACVPKTSEKGDIICVLFGGQVPYVLRPRNDDCYAVVGECYMDGIMHGESLSDDAVTREFRLR